MSDAQRVARAVLREVPVASLTEFLQRIKKPGGELAQGNACGNGCGNNCGNGNACIDRYGHLEIPREEFGKILEQRRELQAALKVETKKALERL